MLRMIWLMAVISFAGFDRTGAARIPFSKKLRAA